MITKQIAEYLLEKYQIPLEALNKKIQEHSYQSAIILNILNALLAIRDEQEFEPVIQQTGMGSIKNISKDSTKAFEQLMGLFTASEGRGDAFRKTFTSTYLKNKNDDDLRGEFLDFIMDANDPEIYLAANLASNRRAGLLSQVNTDSITQAGVRSRNVKNLASKFKLALQIFLEDPNDPIKKKKLVRVSSSIYENVVTDYGLEPDRYNAKIIDMLDLVLDDIKISSRSRVLLENFIRKLGGGSEENKPQLNSKLGELLGCRLSGANKPKNLPQAVLEKNEIQAFYTLTSAYNEYLQKDFSKAQHNIKDKLLFIQTIVQGFKLDNYVVGELKTAYEQLEELVDKHFSLPFEDQKKNYPSFQSMAKVICKNHKKAIESNALLRKVFYNLLNAIAGLVIFYGIYLIATSRSRDSFFPEPAPDPYAQESMSLLDSLSTSISDSNDEVTDDSVEKRRSKIE